MTEKKSKSYIINNEQIELLIPGYPKDSDLTILNTVYVGRRKNEDGKIEKDFIYILFRDNEKGIKKHHIIYEPLFTFYRIDDNKYTIPEHNMFFIEKEKVIPYTCKYADILRALAEVTDNMQFFMNNVSNGNSSENRKLHTCPEIFMSDMNVENYYRFLFNLSYKNEPFKLSKGYLDIEADGTLALSSFPEYGEVPINAVAYCDEANKRTYQFILDYPKNPKVAQYRKKCKEEAVLSELKGFVDNAVGGYKKADKFGTSDMEYTFLFYDDELEMLYGLFELINKSSPDFMMIWNMEFDLNYIIQRILRLGGDPLDVICDKNIEQCFLKFYVDERNRNNYEERGDYVALSSYTVWLDQMIQFASRRKGRGRYQSFKLDAIGEVVAGVHKLNYSHITTDLNMLPYIDMQTFSFYNVMDVIVQKCIEVSTQDCEYVFTKCLVNNTVYPKAHRQSVYLANRFAKGFWEYGYIIGNNKNLWNEKPATKFPGAMVGDPLKNSNKVMMYVNGKPTLLSNNAVDFDYTSLYPSIILENNLAKNTQIGRLIIEEQIHAYEHQDMYSSDDETVKYSRGGEFLENMMCNNPLEFCRRWMGLGDVYEVMDDIHEYFTHNRYRGQSIDYRLGDAIYYTRLDMIDAVTFNGDYKESSPIKTYNDLDESIMDKIVEVVKGDALL